tara:strand:+ start:127 stop:300 length:174 start_codon:yes stop_codon:yes gene_type:complete
MNENKKLKNLLRSVKTDSSRKNLTNPEDILAQIRSRQQDEIDSDDVTTFLQNLSKKK